MADAAADPRAALVSDAISQYSRRGGIPVSTSALDYILWTTLAEPADFASGLSAQKFSTADVRTLLVEALLESMKVARQQGQREVTQGAAEIGFERIIDSKHNCPFPFIIC